MWLTSSLKKRGLRCSFSPTKVRKSYTSRSAKDRNTGNAQRQASTVVPSPTPIGAQGNDAEDNTTVAARTPVSTNTWNTSGTPQSVLRNQVALESLNGKWDSELYVDRILSPLEPTGTPEEVRSRYPEGRYSVSRQTVDEHG
jgi:hypothetical protein